MNPMNLRNLSVLQREAMLDLALLAMYADGHLASAEDERVHRLLAAMGLDEAGSDLARHYDAAVARVRSHAQSAAAARAHALQLAARFATPEHRRNVVAMIDELVASDSRVAPQESDYLAAVQGALRI
jgi:uncharacterized tellurite resistance protein B-like protein